MWGWKHGGEGSSGIVVKDVGFGSSTVSDGGGWLG